MKSKSVIVVIVFTFLWMGFVGAISFMEAWLKFRAPGITISLGLGIGRLVFSALNKVEWFFCIVLMLNLVFMSKNKMVKRSLISWLGICFCILLVQTWGLLPILDKRAELYLQGALVPASNVHFYYVVLEVCKEMLLLIFGVSLIKNNLLKS